MRYDPGLFSALSFHDCLTRFAAGQDTPRAYLERCLEQASLREPVAKAFVAVDEALTRADADAGSARWKAGAPLSAIDGMPVAVHTAMPPAFGAGPMPADAVTAVPGHSIGCRHAVRSALLEAGAAILSRLATADGAGVQRRPTTHPFDARCTPGGLSGGAAAAVAARMCPAALVSTACACVICSASYCGAHALEPTPGAVARGKPAVGSPGVRAGSVEDLWQVAIAIAQRAGGHAAHAGLRGPGLTPEAMRPRCLIVIESAPCQSADNATRMAFEALLDQIACTGVLLLRRRDHPSIEAFEQAIVAAGDDGALLLRRSLAQRAHAALAPLADAVVMLSASGPAPLAAGEQPLDTPRAGANGDPVCIAPSALLLAPAVRLPLMSVDGLPLEAQPMGQRDDDARLVSLARWAAREAGTVVV